MDLEFQSVENDFEEVQKEDSEGSGGEKAAEEEVVDQAVIISFDGQGKSCQIPQAKTEKYKMQSPTTAQAMIPSRMFPRILLSISFQILRRI